MMFVLYLPLIMYFQNLCDLWLLLLVLIVLRNHDMVSDNYCFVFRHFLAFWRNVSVKMSIYLELCCLIWEC